MKSKISTIISAFIFILAVASGMTAFRLSMELSDSLTKSPELTTEKENNPSGGFILETSTPSGASELSAFLFQPVITCPSPDTVDCNSPIDTTTLGIPVVLPDAACLMGIDTLFYSDSLADFDCPNTYNLFRIWIVVDSCGLSDTCIQSIRVQDTTRPTITCPDDLTIYRDGACAIDTTLGTTGSPSIGDNCGTPTLDYSDNTTGLDQCSGTGSIVRTFTVTDSCGNTNTCDQTITVLDTTRPTITCPSDTLVSCFTDVPTVDLNAVISLDNCTLLMIITHEGDSIGDSTCINGLTVFRTYRATDSCGNFNECIQRITVLDTESPQFTYFPNDTQVVCASDLPVQIPLATDNCGLVRVSLVEDIVMDSGCINQFTLLHIWEAVDTCQNMVRDTQVVVVRDTILPQFTYFPNDTLVNCVSDLPVQFPEASDNCGLVRVSLVENIITDSNCINQFTLLHIWEAVDTCQNMIRDTQVVVVRDTILPVFTLFPNDTTVACTAEIPFQAPEASDNCGLVRVSLVEENTIDSSCINQKTRLFIWEAVDTCQNAIRDTQFVYVLDTVGPVIPIPGNVDVVQCGTFFSIVLGIVATDNCDGMVPVDADISIIDSTCPGDYKILIVYTSGDTCGNFTEVRDTIVVIDTLDPVITCPGDFTLECDGGLPPPITSLDSFFLAGGQIYDSCCLDSSSFRFVQEILDCPAEGDPTLSRYYAIDDCCGHSDTCIQVITIPVCLLDLALRKTLNAPEPYFAGYGGTVPFTITVYNQFCVPADSIKIIEYLPSIGSSVVDPGWVNNNDGTACLLLTSNDLLPAGGLPMGDSVVISFTVQLGFDFADGTGINRAEIFSANTPDGPAADVDSEPNNNPGDDIIVDDVIDNSGSDEDDYDIAQFFVCQPLVCNDHVNVGLEADCEICFTADDFLEGGFLPEEYYTIELFSGGKKLPGNCVGRAYLGYTLTYSVLINSPCGNNSCWGTVTIEDKEPPFIDCSPDTVLCFELSNLPSEGTVIDNCSGPVKVSVVSEQYIDYGCDSAFIQGVVKRRLIATDTWKNTMDCEKIYYVRRLNIEDLVCPRDTVIDCSLEIVNKVPFTNPARSGAPTIEGIALWPNNVSCKVLTDYKDEISEVCGDGYKIYRTWTIVDWCGRRDTMCTQTIKVIDQTPPLAYDRTLQTMSADPHVCRAQIQLDTLAVSDCSKVIQTYSYPYLDEATGVIKIASGTLPARVWVTSGVTVIDVTLTDGCFNRSQNTITVKVVDETPPTPVCKEYTQVTVDPVSCWTVVKAKDLDNGSHDNCIGQLHFAVARMADIEKARTDYLAKIEAECGIKEYKDHKAWYDQYIEDWINMYVFDDELHMDDCGENQVVLRVYEADSMPRMDSHIWPCGEHEWFLYNTYSSYRLVHNYHFFSTNPPATKDCDAGAPWLCKKASEKWFADRKAQFEFSRYYGANEGANFPQTRLFNDCMVKVIVDDKQPPVVDHLEDITVYCDNAPAGKAYARQLCKYGEEFQYWPGPLNYKGVTYGYYGGSDHIQRGHTDHQDPIYGCDHEDQWAPIYCRSWLYLDSFDQSGPVDPAQYFSTLVKFDKDRPSRALGAKEFSITDNCRLDDTTMHFTDIGSVNGCGEGWYQRTWTIKDKCGNVAVAVQKVIVKHRSDYEVVFPPDLEVTCDTENATDSSQTGKPLITDDECEIIGVRYVDEISSIDQGDGSCYKIIRTWTLIDWCIYDPNAHTIHPDVIVDDRLRANETDRVCVFRNLKDNGDGFMRYVQIIKVFDHEAPMLNCRDTTICLTEACQKAVNIPLEGLDNCAEEILYRLDITRPDGSTETRVNVNSITGNFTSGVYTIRIIGKDNCDNADTCTMRLTMRDCKEPTPYCLNGVATVVMPLTGAIEIWAKDLDRGSSDNCTPNSNLKFSFSSNVSEASRVFRCSDILDGKQQAIPVDIWVTDQAGNQNYCRTYILLQDNGGQPGGTCKDTTLSTANINGKLYTEDKEGVEFATVELKGVGQAAIPSFKTGSDGNYAFSNIQLTGTVSIKALRDDNPMNGLSTLDLVLLQKHLLGTEKLKSPYKVIAADVNNSQDISVVDLVELRKLILGIYDNIPGNTSWKFIPKSHSFADVQNPWGYPAEEQMDKMNEQEVRDFVGVKIGDLNSSAVPHSLIGTEVRGNEIGLTLETEDRLVKKGEEVSVTFRSPNFRGISGWQGTLHTGSLEFTGIRKIGKLDLTDDHIGRRWANEGMLTMSWNHHTGIDLDEEAPLFTLVFKAGEEGRLSEMLRFGSQHTIAESYEGKGELGGLSLRFVTADGNAVESRSELYQNYPNPFDQRTVIGINLAREGKGVLRILDITGRTIKSIERDWTKGYQEVWLDRREIGATGVLYYRFESEFFTASRKMLIME